MQKNMEILLQSIHIQAGLPAKIELLSDRTTIRANRPDVVYITVNITDENGIFNPFGENEIIFK